MTLRNDPAPPGAVRRMATVVANHLITTSLAPPPDTTDHDARFEGSTDLFQDNIGTVMIPLINLTDVIQSFRGCPAQRHIEIKSFRLMAGSAYKH